MKKPPRLERFLVALCVWMLPAIKAPATQGLTFHASFDSYVQEGGVVGAAYVVLDKGKVEETRAIGMADLEMRQAVNSNTIFHWASITKTQSPSPALFLPGGLNCLLPVFANGEPLTSVYSPFVGSYQRAVDMAVSFDMSTVIRRIDGMYAITKEPSEVRAAVRQV